MTLDLGKLRALIIEVKPSVAGRAFGDSDLLDADLGLDSLDLLQLGRKVQRASGAPFVIEEWAAEQRSRGLSVAALLSAVERSKASG